MNIHQSILANVEVFLEPNAQLQYEASLVNAEHAPTELTSALCDDLFDPENESFINEFSRDEHKEIAHLYGLVAEAAQSDYSTVSELLKNRIWRRVVRVSQQLNRQLRIAR